MCALCLLLIMRLCSHLVIQVPKLHQNLHKTKLLVFKDGLCSCQLQLFSELNSHIVTKQLYSVSSGIDSCYIKKWPPNNCFHTDPMGIPLQYHQHNTISCLGFLMINQSIEWITLYQSYTEIFTMHKPFSYVSCVLAVRATTGQNPHLTPNVICVVV